MARKKCKTSDGEAEGLTKRNRKIWMIAVPVIAAVTIFLVILNTVIIPNGKYNDAVALMEAGNYIEAKAAFEALEGYKDSADQILECKYREAAALMEAGENAKAAIAFGKIADYRDSREQSFALWDRFAVRETISGGCVGLKSDGTVVAVGRNDDGQCEVSDWTDIVAVSAGDNHTVGLKSDGTVVAVGRNGDGQCDVSDWSEIVAISAGLGYTVGLRSDGTVAAAGSNDYGECDVSDWNNIRVRNVKN